MLCPHCKKETLEKVILLNVEVDYCGKCEGIWFDNDELRWVKDKRDANLNWLDIDLWRYPQKFSISRSGRLCPHCRMPLYEVEYGDSKVHPVKCRETAISPSAKLFNGVNPVKSASGGAASPQFNGVKVDLCNLCKGIWLDRGEFKEIIRYLKKRADYEILHHFSRNIIPEFWEVFSGPESVREEILDLVTILKLFNYRFITQHPYLATIIKGVLPKP